MHSDCRFINEQEVYDHLKSNSFGKSYSRILAEDSVLSGFLPKYQYFTINFNNLYLIKNNNS